MDNGSKSAKVLVIFFIAIIAFGLSNSVAFLTGDLFNFDFLNFTDDTNVTSNILESNHSKKDTSPIYQESSKANDKNEVNIINKTEPEPEPEPDLPQNNTHLETNNSN